MGDRVRRTPDGPVYGTVIGFNEAGQRGGASAQVKVRWDNKYEGWVYTTECELEPESLRRARTQMLVALDEATIARLLP
jgi:hypothetical protein